MSSSLGDLCVVPLELLILHETHEPGRLYSLCRLVEAEGVQRNPVIASPHRERYLILDGAHRVHALRELGCRLILVQLVEPPAQAESWGHLLRVVEPEPALRSLSGIEVSEEPAGAWLATIQTGKGTHMFVRARRDRLLEEVRAMWRLQSIYPEGVPVRRVEPGERLDLRAGEALIRYRAFAPEELAEVVRAGEVLPAGITRFRIEERVLGVRFPLEKLRSGEPATRNTELKTLIQERWEADRIRRYDEPIVLFE